MRDKTILIYLILLLSLGCPAFSSLKIYLLAGQSNMDGRADNDGLPTELQVPQADVQIYFEGIWYDLQPGLSFLQFGQSFGPEITFGRNIADAYPDEAIVLIKYARGGTSLAVDWKPDTGAQYNAFMSAVTNALNSLQGQYELRIAGMIWMQGERDSKYLDLANAYEQNLTGFIQAVRDDVSQPLMPFVIGQISESSAWTYGDIVRQAQTNVADTVDYVDMVVTSDLPMNSDGIHYNAAGQMTLGGRFADAMVVLEHACGQWGYAPGDYNLDCDVNLADMAWLGSLWMPTCLDQQNCIDMQDLLILASSWLSCSFPNTAGCVNYWE